MLQISILCVLTPVHAGDAVGTRLDGDRVGDNVVGRVVGANDGARVGDNVGIRVVGADDGTEVVGSEVVGETVGDLVGSDVVGEIDGEAVGSEVVGDTLG